MQTHACSFGICRETVDGGLIELGSRMKEINRLCVRGGGALLEAGDKRRDADARTHPNLTWLRILEVEAAVRTFHCHRHADLQSFPQAAGVVAQRLGDEDEPTVGGIPGRGDGIGMGAYAPVRGDEGGLSGAAAIDATAAAAGVPCKVGCNAETRLGTAASAHFIAAHENVHYGDIDSFMLLAETDWLSGGFTADGPTLTLSDRPGLGVDVRL